MSRSPQTFEESSIALRPWWTCTAHLSIRAQKGVAANAGNGQVVQQREGVRLHPVGGGRGGHLRPSHGDRRRRFQDAQSGGAGELRGRAGPEGGAGRERAARVSPPHPWWHRPWLSGRGASGPLATGRPDG